MSLASLYSAQPTQEDLEKTAEAKLFAEIAANNGIDLTKMANEEVIALWNYTFGKEAEEETKAEEEKETKADEEKEEGEEEKKEAAAREHATKLAFAKEAEQADQIGRIMAKAYVDELNKIGAALQAEQAKEAAANAETPAEGTKEAAMPKALKGALDKVRGAVGKQHGPTSSTPPKGSFSGPKTRMQDPVGAAAEFGSKHKKTLGVGAGAAALGAGGGYAAGRKKESSAIDPLALEQAVKIANDAGFDPEEAAARVAAVYTLGLEDSTKLASELDQQVEIRALEYLEAAGYPVEWAQ